MRTAPAPPAWLLATVIAACAVTVLGPGAAIARSEEAAVRAPDGAGDGGALYGRYPMTRESSGTSWQPDAADMPGAHATLGRWAVMTHAAVTLAYTAQGGPRGESATYSESLLMVTARRDLGPGFLSLRAMGSLEPVNGAAGYPLLFQTGESANGVEPLIDRQHPHNLVDELAAAYSRSVGEAGSVFVYAGPVGEPALGPPAFVHRGASEDNPEAPLTHHWLDATHVSFGVVTLGTVWRRWKLEGSAFNGREPDQHRYAIELRGLDSASLRLSFNPGDAWSLQASQARLASPEALLPGVSVRRSTVSAILDRPLARGHWQTLVAWGRNAPSAGRASDGWLLDSALDLGAGARVFGRLEQVVKDELFVAGPLAGEGARIRKASVGYLHEFESRGRVRIAVGGVVSRHFVPAALAAAYAREPTSVTLFVRARLVD